MSIQCDVCFRKCILKPGQTGACHARINVDDTGVLPGSYGYVTGLALDPIEKKPLYHFHPGSLILSVGSFGCNLKCPFCQNVDISMADDRIRPDSRYLPPEELAQISLQYADRGNIGVAFTYNEPLICYEYVRDCARLIHAQGQLCAVVTNGCVSGTVADELEGLIDAMNIDLKSFSADYYRDVLKGDLETTRAFITRAAGYCHVELTTLIIPGENDSEEEISELSGWIAELEQKTSEKIPLHITRFFPRSRYSHRQPTPVEDVLRLTEVARRNLEYVYPGNI